MFSLDQLLLLKDIFEKNFRVLVLFVRPLILLLLLVVSAPGFQGQGGSLACMLCHLCAMDS